MVLYGGVAMTGDDRAILQYRRMLRQRLVEYESGLLSGYRLARGTNLPSPNRHKARDAGQGRS